MLPEPIFGIFHLYGIMLSLGFLGAVLILTLYGRYLGVDQELCRLTLVRGVMALFAGWVCAALFQSLYDFIEEPAQGIRLSGATFLGGLIGGGGFFLLSCLWKKRKHGITFSPVLPIMPCCLTFAHALGRIGCFFAGCCYGRETDSWLGVEFPHLRARVHPTQLYEAAFLFLLFAVLSLLVFVRRQSYNVPLYFIAYGCFRFGIEILRGDDRGSFIGALSPSQFWSVFLAVCGTAWLIYIYLKGKGKGHEYRKDDTV